MELRIPSPEQLRTIYAADLKESFPPAELKPLQAIEEMWRDGWYRPWCLFDGDDIAGECFLWLGNPGWALLDYLCVSPRRRNGGVGALLGATGGYIVGFLPAAAIAGLGAERLGRGLPALILSMCAGLLVCYALGTAWYVAVYARAGEVKSVSAVLAACVVPFIPADAAKIFLAATLSRRLAPLCAPERRRR